MASLQRPLLIALLLFALPIRAIGLPDTGQDTCYNDTVADSVAASNAASFAKDTGTHPRQDCRYGRDAAAAVGVLLKTGAGAKGFDYTKVANNGTMLGAEATLGTAATDWACTKDNITGLIWEVKTAANTDLRSYSHSYFWYSSDSTSNGGNAGFAGDSYNACNNTLPGGLCNTQAFTTAVNAAALCTYIDWRTPTQRELLTLVYAEGSSPSIVATYFPNTPATEFWSGTTYSLGPPLAWMVSFYDGWYTTRDKTFNLLPVRLVRGGPF